MKNFSLLFLLIFSAGCRQEKILQSNILVTGHGGDGFLTFRNLTPPNTLAAMNRAFFVEGADAVEMDVQLTSDSVLILFHDITLDAGTDFKGCVSSYSFEDLSKCNIGTRNGPANGTYTIPALEEIFQLLEPTDAILFLNIKAHDPCVQQNLGSYYQRFARELSRLIGNYHLYSRTFVETLDLNFLLACRSQDSSFRFIFDGDGYDFNSTKQITIDNQFEGFALLNSKVSADQIEEARLANLLVIIWGVKTLPGTNEAVAKNPYAIMTDDVRMLREAVDR